MPDTLRVWPYSSYKSSQTDINRAAHTVRPCRVRLWQYSEAQRVHTGLKGQVSHARTTRVPFSKPSSPIESFSKVPCSWPMQRMRLWFIHTTAGKLGIVFTEFFTSSSVTSTTVQCSSSSGRGSSPPFVSHGCTCVGRNRDSCSSPFYSRALRYQWWERNGGTGLIMGVSCWYCSIFHFQQCISASSLGNRCNLVPGQMVSPNAQCCHTHCHQPASWRNPAPSESSLKHFENPSYPEPFHLFPLTLTLQSRATCALCLGESRSFMHLHEQGLRCLILGSEYCSLMLLEWLSTYINSKITHLATV